MLLRAAVLLSLITPAVRAESSLIECVADLWYSAPGKLDGSGHTLQTDPSSVILLAFRVAAIERWKVEKAVIVLHMAARFEPGKITVSLIDGPWLESSMKPPPLREPALTIQKTKPDGWISIPVPPALVQAVVDNKATGFAVSVADAKQTFHSRETIEYSPFLAVVGRPPSK
jgi:hypothetical protein